MESGLLIGRFKITNVCFAGLLVTLAEKKK